MIPKSPVKIETPKASSSTVPTSELDWSNLSKFAWDQGEYNSQWVTVYLTSDLDGVGAVKDAVTCDFTESSFDLKVVGLNGKNYRLLKSSLDKEIVPEKSKFTVKENKITIKLKKVKGEYSYEQWTDLTSKKDPAQKKKEKDDPMSGLMDMMKTMYDDGDDQMKKTIGEAMMKQRSGQLDEP